MDYNDKKVRAFTYLENMIRKNEEKGIDVDILIYEIETQFGFGKLLVTKRLDLLKRVGKISIDMGVVKWN